MAVELREAVEGHTNARGSAEEEEEDAPAAAAAAGEHSAEEEEEDEEEAQGAGVVLPEAVATAAAAAAAAAASLFFLLILLAGSIPAFLRRQSAHWHSPRQLGHVHDSWCCPNRVAWPEYKRAMQFLQNFFLQNLSAVISCVQKYKSGISLCVLHEWQLMPPPRLGVGA